MSYRVRRIDPFWISHPAVISACVLGVLLAMFGYAKNSATFSIFGGVLTLGGVFLATKRTISALLATLGFIGGLITFVILPNPSLAEADLFWKLVSTLFFAVLYMTLMDALILVVSAVYNFFSHSMNWGGIHLDIEEIEDA